MKRTPHETLLHSRHSRYIFFVAGEGTQYISLTLDVNVPMHDHCIIKTAVAITSERARFGWLRSVNIYNSYNCERELGIYLRTACVEAVSVGADGSAQRRVKCGRSVSPPYVLLCSSWLVWVGLKR